jgi:PhzF family phenazine biosynthesis protein
MRRPCYVVDAFTDRALAGNPAGVLLDAQDLDARAMQRIAAEMKHSETAFPLPPLEAGSALHLRWFTPESEVAFCGHATLATFHVLAEEAGRISVQDGAVTRTSFTCKSGRLNVELSRRAGKVRISVETPAGHFEPARIPLELTAALGIVPESLDPRLPPHKSLVLEGNLYLAVRDRDALARCKPEAGPLDSLGRRLGAAGFVVYTCEPAPGIDAAVRCFFPGYGIVEDPATGSAAGQLGALLHLLRPGPLPRALVFTQGDEIGRPGRIEVEVRPDRDPRSVRGWIGGNAVTILRGEMEL